MHDDWSTCGDLARAIVSPVFMLAGGSLPGLISAAMAPFLIIAAGIAGWLVYVTARRRILAIQTWPTVPAMIAESRVEKTYRRSEQTSGPRQRPMYAPKVMYVYHVAGVDYRHDAIAPVGSGSRSPRPAQATVDRYPAGRACEVRYNPERPQEAFLEPGDPNDGRLFAIVGSIAIVAGLLLIGRI